MKSIDNISEIGIDSAERLYVKPENREFSMIWRSAAEVHWDNNHKFLYSPKPREWTYLMWFQHISGIVNDEYGCRLVITADTKWVSITEELKQQITDTYT